MTNVTVDNKAVSKTVTESSNVTVPAGEVWRVTIVAGYEDDEYNTTFNLKINGEIVRGTGSGGNYEPFETALKGGDTVSLNTSNIKNGAAHIGGFVVNE